MQKMLSKESVQLNPSEKFVLRDKLSPGFVLRDNFLGPIKAEQVLSELLVKKREKGIFRKAGIGKGHNFRLENDQRGDLITWLPYSKGKSEDPTSTALIDLLDRINVLVSEFAQESPEFGLTEICSTQFAIFVCIIWGIRYSSYCIMCLTNNIAFLEHACRQASHAPPRSAYNTKVIYPSRPIYFTHRKPGDGSRFVKHVDTYSSDDANELNVRKITCLYYLNKNWKTEHGGQLRIYPAKSPGNFCHDRTWDISPLLDRLVVFRSEDVEHEVLPSFNERLAITVWYYGVANGKRQESDFFSRKEGTIETAGPTPSPKLSKSDFKSMLNTSNNSSILNHISSFVGENASLDYQNGSSVESPRHNLTKNQGPNCSNIASILPEYACSESHDKKKHEQNCIFDTILSFTEGNETTKKTMATLEEALKQDVSSTYSLSQSKHLECQTTEEQDSLNNLIFVSIPSYRDSELEHTIANLFETATVPERIVVGVCFQYNSAEDNIDILRKLPPQFKKLVRILHVDWKDAKGPVYARYLTQKLWRNEPYYLQIDSHMRFRSNWDCYLIEQLHACPSRKSIITTYPPGYDLPNKPSKDLRPIVLCGHQFDSNGVFRQIGRRLKDIQSGPIQSSFWAAGFAFSRSDVIAEVPYQSELKYLFFGEEISMTVRLWRSGWDFFAPSEVVLFHNWSRAYRPSFRESTSLLSRKVEEESRKNMIVTTSTDYVRTLEEYETFSGINLSKRIITPRAMYGNLDKQMFVDFTITTRSENSTILLN